MANVPVSFIKQARLDNELTRRDPGGEDVTDKLPTRCLPDNSRPAEALQQCPKTILGLGQIASRIQHVEGLFGVN
jgi:hypothetical protein